MTDIIDLLHVEEGWNAKPYIDTEGYPTIGYGFKIGPKLHGSPAVQQDTLTRYYTFTLPREAGDAWLRCIIESTITRMLENNRIAAALAACAEPRGSADFDPSNPRAAVLISMAYQMGVEGLAGFRNTLLSIANRDWFQAETGMLKSRWANQTPNRARRHAWQMRHGQWHQQYGG